MKYSYFSVGNDQRREPALCQLYRHIFVPYCRRPVDRRQGLVRAVVCRRGADCVGHYARERRRRVMQWRRRWRWFLVRNVRDTTAAITSTYRSIAVCRVGRKVAQVQIAASMQPFETMWNGFHGNVPRFLRIKITSKALSLVHYSSSSTPLLSVH